MGTLTDTIRQAGRQSAVPGEGGAFAGPTDSREQAIIDRYKKGARRESLFQEIAQGEAELEIDTRRQQRAYSEKPPTPLAQMTVDHAKEMVSNLGDRAKVLDTYRKMSPEQRQEALKLAPGIAQQLGDDRGGVVGRTLGAVSRGISSFSQPAMELAGKVTGTDWGGSPEEIAFIRQLEGLASQEFSPARPGDPWYQSYPLQAAEMTVNAAPLIGGGIAGSALGKTGGQLLARGASAGVPLAKPTFQAVGAVGKLPKIIGLKGATTKGTMAGLGTVAGITATGLPQQYAQEIDQLKELGMEDNWKMQSLAVGTALVTSSLEAIMPNPYKKILPKGSVSLKEGAIKAARQYLWEAAKKAPAEISEEYAQGLSSGLGKWVAQYIDENAESKSIGDAFKTSFEQGNAAIGPMAFMLGVPGVAGAGLSAARAQRLQQTLAKGFVSEDDAKQLGIQGKNRKEREANAKAELRWWDFGTGEPAEPTSSQPALPPALPPKTPTGSGAAPPPLPSGTQQSTPPALPTTATPPALPPSQAVSTPAPPLPKGRKPQLPLPLPKGVPDASQVPTNEESNDARRDGGEQSPVDSGGEVRGQGQDQGSAKQPSQEPATQQVQVEPRKFSYQNGRVQVEVPPPYEVGGKSVQPFVMNGKTYIGAEDFKANAEEAYAETVKRYPDLAPPQAEAAKPAVDPVSERDQAEDEFAGLFEEKPPETPAPQQAEATTAPVASERDQAEDELAGLFGEEETPEPPKPTEKPPQAAKAPATQPGWEIVEGSDSKLYRENQDPDIKPSQRIATRTLVDPSENVLATKDIFGKPVPPGTLAARQEFVDKAKPGTEFEIKGFPGQINKVHSDGRILNSSGRWMGNVQSRANQVKPGDVTWVDSKPETKSPELDVKQPELETKAPELKPPAKLGTKGAIKPARKMETTEEGRPDELAGLFGEEAPTEKPKPAEPWQQTPSEYVSGETDSDVVATRKAAHPQAVKQALEQGKQVPRPVLDAYANNTWAKKAIERLYPSSPGTSEEVGTKPTTGPTENQSSEAPADKPIKIGRKGAAKPTESTARRMEPTEEGRPADGKPIIPGDRFLTNTGRETTPYPKYSGSTERGTTAGEKKSQLWLMENAIAEAESRGDDFNLRTFRSELEDARKGKLPQASKDSATIYVFGDSIPQVPKPLLKPVAKPQESLSQDKKPSVPTGKQDTGTSRGQSGEQVGNKPSEKPIAPKIVKTDKGDAELIEKLHKNWNLVRIGNTYHSAHSKTGEIADSGSESKVREQMIMAGVGSEDVKSKKPSKESGTKPTTGPTENQSSEAPADTSIVPEGILDESSESSAAEITRRMEKPAKEEPPTEKPPELHSPAEYRATLAKPTIQAIDLATSQLTDMQIEHDVLESILADGLKKDSVLTQERRVAGQLKQLLDCLKGQ